MIDIADDFTRHRIWFDFFSVSNDQQYNPVIFNFLFKISWKYRAHHATPMSESQTLHATFSLESTASYVSCNVVM